MSCAVVSWAVGSPTGTRPCCSTSWGAGSPSWELPSPPTPPKQHPLQDSPLHSQPQSNPCTAFPRG